MEQVVANIYAACLSAEAEPHAELVDLTINAVQDGLAGPNKDETLGAIFTAVTELTAERQQKGALFRIKLTAIASAAKSLPANNRDALLKSLRAMGEVARQHSLSSTTDTIKTIVDAIGKMDTTAVGQPSPPPAPPKVDAKPEAPKVQNQGGVTLQQFLMQNARHAASDKIAFAPDIPLKKMSGALNSIGGYVKAEDVVVVIDDTVFGGSKEGLFITNDRIFVKEAFTDLAIYRLDSIQHIGAEGRKIFINRREIVGMTQPDKSDLELLFSAINNYLNLSRPQPASAPAPAYAPPQQPVYEEEEEEESEDNSRGFYDNLVRQLASVPYDEHHTMRLLMVELLNISDGLYGFLQSRAVLMTEPTEWYVTTDSMRLESLLYTTLLCRLLLVRKYDFEKEVGNTFLAQLYGVLITQYVNLYTRPQALDAQIKLRQATYFRVFENDPGGLPQLFMHHFSTPITHEYEDADVESMMTFAIQEFMSNSFDVELACDYFKDVSMKVEAALYRYIQQVAADAGVQP